VAKANKKAAKDVAKQTGAAKKKGGAKPAAAKKSKASAAAKKKSAAKKPAAANKPAAGKSVAKKKSAAKKSDASKSVSTGGKTIESYTAQFPDWRGVALNRIREVITAAAPDASASIKWAQPVFEHNGPFAFMRAHTKHVNLGFWRGKELDDPEQRLESGGDRMAHVKIGSVDDIDESQFSEWVRQAVALNDEKGNPTKRAQR
jgi:hypothetical protein